MSLAPALPGLHPPHISFQRSGAGRFGWLTRRRDAWRSACLSGSEDNAVEIFRLD